MPLQRWLTASSKIHSAVAPKRGLRAWTRRQMPSRLTNNGGGLSMKVFAGVLAAGMIACCNPAFADDIDLSTWTCKQFQSADKETIEIVLTWLDGYYKDQDDPPVIETHQFVENAKKLGEYCSAHPDIGLITAADKLFSSD
jgi:acid stress chaperone HdeB